jgi:hypothetical protein
MSDKLLRFLLPSGGFALAAWVLFYPRPYRVCIIVALLFPIVIFIVSRIRADSFSLIDEKRGVVYKKIDLAGPLGISSAALSLRAFIDFRFPDTPDILLLIGAATLLVGLVWWVAIPGASLSIALLTGGFYGFPAVAYINASGQQFPPRSLSAQVIDKHVYTKPQLRTIVVLAEGERHEFTISKEYFATIETGSRICLTEQHGLLRLRSLALTDCSTSN